MFLSQKGDPDFLKLATRELMETLPSLFNAPELKAKGITFQPLQREGDRETFLVNVYEDRLAKFEVHEDGLVNVWDVPGFQMTKKCTIPEAKTGLLNMRSFFEKYAK